MNSHDHLSSQNDFAISRSRSIGNRSRSNSVKRTPRPGFIQQPLPNINNNYQTTTNGDFMGNAPPINSPNMGYNATPNMGYKQAYNSPGMPANVSPSPMPLGRSRTLPGKPAIQNGRMHPGQFQKAPPQQQQQQQQQLQEPYQFHQSSQPQYQTNSNQNILPRDQRSSPQRYEENSRSPAHQSLNRSKTSAGAHSLRKNMSLLRRNQNMPSPMLQKSPQKFNGVADNDEHGVSSLRSFDVLSIDSDDHGRQPNPFNDDVISLDDGSVNQHQQTEEAITLNTLLKSIMKNRKINKIKFACDPAAQYNIKTANSWVEYCDLKPSDYGKMSNRSLQKQEILFQLIKYQQLNSKNDKKDIWDTIGYDFLFSQDESIVFPETKAEVYDDFFGYFNTLQQLEELCEKYLYQPLLDELNKNKDESESKKKTSSHRLFNINTICEIINTWLFKIIDSYQMYINQLIVTKFWLEMELFKDQKSNIFLNWLNNNFKSKFPYQELISNYLIDNLINYVHCLEKLLELHSHKKSSTSYKKISIVLNSLQTFVTQCHSHYSSMEFKNFLSKFNWNCSTAGNIQFKWKNLKIINRNKINNSSNNIDYLILFNNCLVLCKLDIYLKEIIVKEYPFPIEFLEIWDINNNELKLVHRGKSGISYDLMFFDRSLKEHWKKLIMDTKVSYITEKAQIDPFEMIPITTNFVNGDNYMQNPQATQSKLKYYESQPILNALKNSKNLANINTISGKILCSLTMNFHGQTYHLIGTSNGLFIDDINRTGLNWKKLSGIRYVKQVEVVEEHNRLIVFAGDQIVQFDFNNIIKSILDTNYHLVGHDLSNQKVLFFKMGYINGEWYLFYRYIPATIKKKGLEMNNINQNPSNCHFKILKLNPRGEFETFKEFALNDINCFDAILLKDTTDMIYLSTNRGFAKLLLKTITLLPLQIIPSYVYNSQNNYSLDDRMFLQKIEQNLGSSKPIKIIETNNPDELLLTFETFAIFIDRNTDLLSRFDIIHFNVNVENIAFKNNAIFAIRNNVIEVFKIHNHRVSENGQRSNKFLSHEQVVVAENISLIDSSSSSITVVLDHPTDGSSHQLVLQLVEKKQKKETQKEVIRVQQSLVYQADSDGSDSDDSDSESSESESEDSESEGEDDDDGYSNDKRKSMANNKSREKKLALEKMRIMDSNTRLPNNWISLWELNVNDFNSNFIKCQELIYQLMKTEEELNFQAKSLHRSLGFKFLSDSVNDSMIYPDSKDSIYRHTFGCLNPLMNLHEKFLLRPMLEILNLKSKELPLYDILTLYDSWISEATFIYSEYASRMIKSEWFFQLQERNENAQFLHWLNFDPIKLKEKLELFYTNLINLVDHFHMMIQNIQINRNVDSNIEIFKIEAIANKIQSLQESVALKLKTEKFSTITESLSWEIEDDLAKKSFLSNCVKKMIKFDEIFIKVNDGQNKIYKKKRMIMLFPNWLLIIKCYKDQKVFKVVENPLNLDTISFEYSNSDHNAINVYNNGGKILYKFGFGSRIEKKEWYDAFAAREENK
ncbi:hypothetical protein DASC09_008170 [Saccharomycopsis crataegensis]|uniref:CNH domain-containing protein n=1 Tax=Saccharomycopsis crataegensis TaxID=43959 RepID=A0AAV5QFG9_9ASCO|nr:hypothetical protein DASC09_008170 [Saccharomycopsis crataegensis]